jgi:hypothetical protein
VTGTFCSRSLSSSAAGNTQGCIQVEIGGLAANPFTGTGFKYHTEITSAVKALFAGSRSLARCSTNC